MICPTPARPLVAAVVAVAGRRERPTALTAVVAESVVAALMTSARPVPRRDEEALTVVPATGALKVAMIPACPVGAAERVAEAAGDAVAETIWCASATEALVPEADALTACTSRVYPAVSPLKVPVPPVA